MSDKQVTIGSDERRKIARKLRAAAVYLPDDIDSEDLEMAIATTVCNYDVPNVERLLNRLADLIEPPTQCPYYHSGRHYCSVHEDLPVGSRDVLLALADEIEKNVMTVEHYDLTLQTKAVADYASRIREALGIKDG